MISSDTKKKELVGNYKNGGRTWQISKRPIEVNRHDFPDKTLGKAIPYGVYDLAMNKGYVMVGITHDTAEFAVASIENWWERWNHALRAGVLAVMAGLLAAACLPAARLPPQLPTVLPTQAGPLSTAILPAVSAGTPLPTREAFAVGQVYTYTAQEGDTLVSLAAHFNTSADKIRAKNPELTSGATITPGLTLRLPADWFPLGGSAYKNIPDSALVYGPSSKGFDVDAFVAGQPGYLHGLSAFVDGSQSTGGQAVQYYAEQYSINPRLLLALMEWRTGALSQPDVSDDVRSNPFGALPGAKTFNTQMTYVAEQLSAGYYGWRTGSLIDVFMGAQGNFQSSQLSLFAADPIQRQLGTIPAYGLVNLSLGVGDNEDKFRLTFQVRNVFDKAYAAAITNGGPGGSYRYQIPRDADRYFGVTGRVNF